jgi:DNA-binding CsgD family transcriptional regulator
MASFFQERNESCSVSARAALGEPGFEVAQAEGRAMSLRQAVAYALIADESDAEAGAPGRDRVQAAPLGVLTPRELQVLRLVAAGDTSKEIAAALGATVPTINRHIANIYNKIGARGRADAIAFALRYGLHDG